MGRRRSLVRMSVAVLLVPVVLAGAGCSPGEAPPGDESPESSPPVSVSAPASVPASDSGPSGETSPPTDGSSSEEAGAGTKVTSEAQILGTWHTVWLDGQDVADVTDRNGRKLTVRFQRTESELWWMANDGCNDHSGHFSISDDGLLRAEPGGMTQVACLPSVTLHPRNPQVVVEATEARIVNADSTTPQLRLLAGKEVLGIYAFSADG